MFPTPYLTVLTSKIKYLLFKGLTKKEEILFKSFLNLAKNDLEYQIVVLKPSEVDADDPDILIVDHEYEFDSREQGLKDLPTVLVGDDVTREEPFYVTRPVQWSEFKNAVTSLNIEVKVEDNEVERILPEDVRMAIADEEATTDGTEPASSEDFSEEGEYEYELDKLSVDYHSFTNSDYIKVVDDVRQFRDGAEAPPDEPVLLVTDDEANSPNSVLVIETNTLDAWELSESDFSSSMYLEKGANGELQEGPAEDEEVILDQRAGLEMQRDEQFWKEDNEIICDSETWLYTKPERDLVYSHLEPGRWPQLLQRGALSKLPLQSSWRPTEEIRAYPISSLEWVYTLVNETSDLECAFDDDSEYQLEAWPPFNLLEMDNVLLKLCTMLFVRPESVSSLASRSGYGRSTIRGLMNACYKMDLLKSPAQITGEQMIAAGSEDEGMLGKFKEVFR